MKPRRAYPGTFRAEADAAYAAAETRMISRKRVYAYACFASYGHKSFTQQKTVGEFIGFSVRGIQRMIRQAKELGLMRCKRIPSGTTPKGGRGPLRCGGSWKRIIGWGLAAPDAVIGAAAWAWHWHRDQLQAARASLRASLPPLPT